MQIKKVLFYRNKESLCCLRCRLFSAECIIVAMFTFEANFASKFLDYEIKRIKLTAIRI